MSEYPSNKKYNTFTWLSSLYNPFNEIILEALRCSMKNLLITSYRKTPMQKNYFRNYHMVNRVLETVSELLCEKNSKGNHKKNNKKKTSYSKKKCQLCRRYIKLFVLRILFFLNQVLNCLITNYNKKTASKFFDTNNKRYDAYLKLQIVSTELSDMIIKRKDDYHRQLSDQLNNPKTS